MAIAVSQPQAPARRLRRNSPMYRAWQRYRKNWFAVAGLVWVIIFFIIGIIGPWIAPYSYTYADFLHMHSGPSWQHWFGTDTVGYDVFSQILYSIRYALEIALGATCVSFLIGIILGLWAGLSGGIIDIIVMRAVDFMFALPSFFFALILMGVAREGHLPHDPGHRRSGLGGLRATHSLARPRHAERRDGRGGRGRWARLSGTSRAGTCSRTSWEAWWSLWHSAFRTISPRKRA